MAIATNENGSEAGCFTVGEGVTVSGNFTVPGRAVINGSVEGEIAAKEMLVGKAGRITGKVTVEMVDVFGEINDNLTASKALILRSTGRATGAIQYAELEIEKGAQLRGTLTVLGDESASPAKAANGR